MTPERARELLGGLSAGVLTAEERQMLFEAALHDQNLFNEVADELEFATFLQSAETRAQLTNRIEVEPERRSWWLMWPRWVALSGALGATVVLLSVVGPKLAQRRMAEVPQNSGVVSSAPAIVAERNAPALKGPQDFRTESVPNPAPAVLDREKASVLRDRKEERAVRLHAIQSLPGDAAEQRKLALERRAAEQPPRNRNEVLGEQAKALSFDRSGFVPQAAPPPRQLAPGAAEPVLRSAAPVAPGGAGVAAFGGMGGGGGNGIASIVGTVRDSAGAAVANASVSIQNTGTQASTHAVSDANGKFTALGLPPGAYAVTVTAPGFQNAQRTGITVASTQPAQVDIPLSPGPVSDTVAVAASPAPLSTFARAPARAKVEAPASPKAQVAVLDFTGSTAQGVSGRQAADLVAANLVQSEQLRVVDRGSVQQEQTRLQAGRSPSTEEAAALGRRVGADAVIVGTVQPGTPDPKADVSLTAEVIDAKKGRATSKSAAQGTLQGATSKLAMDLRAQLGGRLSGTVTRVDQELVVVTFTNSAPATGAGAARLDVFRGERRIGEFIVNSVQGLVATGRFAGPERPQTGDRVTSPR